MTVRRLSRWWSLPKWERVAFLELELLLSLVWVGLRTAGFERMGRWAAAAPTADKFGGMPGPITPEAHQIAQRCASLAGTAARHGLYQANCLHQALALCRLLRRRCIPAELKVGVKLNGSQLDAHAWVELGGQVLGEPVSGYAAFDRLDATQKMAG